MISAGRVLLMPKGDYDSNTTYEMLDIVSYNGSSYIAKSTTTGNLPTNTTYWQLSAYGGQASNLAGNFAPLETTDYSTRAYAIDEIFVDKDSQLVIATDAITIGDEIEIGSNCETTSIADLLDDIKDHYDALDQRNRKLIGVTQLTAQTDLHLLVPGEYYKKLTNFYVTNAPTGVNQVPTAVFRLTVESGLDESGSSMLLTLRTIDGKVYTQSYDGTSWSTWVEVASKAYVDNGLALKANSADLGTASSKDSTNAITQGSTDLVESGAVYTGLSAKANSADLGTAAEKDSTNVLSSGSTDLIESGAVHSAIQTLTNQVDDISSDLTSISETGTTASRGIEQGTYFYLNGTLVRAKVAIANGATFTLNTNYEVVTAGALNEISGPLISQSVSGYGITIRCYKKGDNKSFKFDGQTTSTVSAGSLITTIPTDYCPLLEIGGFEVKDTASGKRIYVATNGNVLATDELPTSTYLRGGFFYF